ncbi:MAG: DUF3604 domain-containing protein, partial [Thermodesulfovibrionia bacterium]|nr:DUF3604 domain-containing protein [Thermodesulfovibrionia bacterium]
MARAICISRPTITRLLILLLSFFLSGFSNDTFDGEGEATITPHEATLMEAGEYTLNFIVGEHGISAGGGIKIRFPKRQWKPQMEDQTKNNFLKINLSRKGSGYENTITRIDASLDGQAEKIAHVITIRITENPLIKGDVISLILSKTQSGCFSAYTEKLPVASDINGDGIFALIKDFPDFTVRPGASSQIYTVAPTIQQVGEIFDLKVAILDMCSNAAEDYTGTIGFTSSDNKAKLPEPYTFSKANGGVKKFPVVLNTPGYQTVTVSDKKKDWHTKSNPIDCKKTAPLEKVWWGDIHSHTGISFDGWGNGTFRYARDVAGLDFYSMTDHSSINISIGRDIKYGIGISDEEWEFTKRKVIEFDDPGKFVTILGYECSFFPMGHHNVYFNSPNELIPRIPLIRRSEVDGRLLTLWKYLDQRIPDGVDVITIPHHTGKNSYARFRKQYYNPQKRVAIEIYSRHGSSENYDPSHPLSYCRKKNVKKCNAPKNGPHYAQDAWAKKLHLGVIASSDDHRSHPGMGFRATKNKDGNIYTIEAGNPLAA